MQDNHSTQVQGPVTVRNKFFTPDRRRKIQKGVDQVGQTCVRFAWVDGSGPRVTKDDGDSADSQRGIRQDVSDGWTPWQVTQN